MRTVDWRLTRQLFEHFSSTGEPITGFAHGDVEDEFLDAEFAHGVCALVFFRFRLVTAGQHFCREPRPYILLAYHDRKDDGERSRGYGVAVALVDLRSCVGD